jgi:hypothetical protein
MCSLHGSLLFAGMYIVYIVYIDIKYFFEAMEAFAWQTH